MADFSNLSMSDDFTRKAVDAAIKIGMVALLLSWCLHIAQPFINLVVWGIIIAVALYPLHQNLTGLVGSQEKLTATLITLILVLIILGPCVFLADVISENTNNLAHRLHEHDFSIPAPSEDVASWPLIGKPLYGFWKMASTNLEEAIIPLAPQLKSLAKWLLSTSVTGMVAILQMLVSVILSGIFLVNGRAGHDLAVSFGKRMAGAQGEELVALSIMTIRGVARGVLGVAIIQALLAAIGFFVAGVPGAGILTVLCLFLAIVQLPTLILFLPVVIYVFSVHDVVFATLFLLWMLVVGSLDNFLKPILMGRGLDLPLAVIFIGAIGGMIYSGIIGLFVGAVILALGYKLFLSWLKNS